MIASNGRRSANRINTKLERGTVLNDTYEIRRVLGRGGMGQVFEARDRLLNRTVAIKVSWAHIGFEPLMQEAQALAALRGRGVPGVYAIGKHDDLGYYVMERLYGRTLGAHMVQRFTDGHFTIEEALDLLIGIADSLTMVHSAGLIHRDLKPSNIMLAPKNRTVLLDFGLFLTEQRARYDAAICGSPRYIAPEVITESMQTGQAHLIDVYALGIISFMLVGGYAPFDDPSVSGLLAKHVHKDPPPLRVIRADVPRSLCRMVQQMLAKIPEERTFSAEAVAAGFRGIRARLDAEASESSAPLPGRRVTDRLPRTARGSSDRPPHPASDRNPPPAGSPDAPAGDAPAGDAPAGPRPGMLKTSPRSIARIPVHRRILDA